MAGLRRRTDARSVKQTIAKKEINMPSGKRISQKPCSSLSLSLMAVLTAGIIGCQDTPTGVTDAPVQLAVGSASVAAPADAFVDNDNAGGTEDGASWATAFGNLNDALASATDVDGDGAISIWIAEGTYVPSAVYSPGGVEGGAYGEEARSGSGIPRHSTRPIAMRAF